MPKQGAQPVKRARELPREQPAEEDDWVHPIGNDGSVACGVFLLLARRHLSGDVHPTQDLALCALHMLWASVDVSSPSQVARQSFQRLATPGALRLTNVERNAIVLPSISSHLRQICLRPRANVIVRIDTEALTGVTEIGDGFLSGCSSLRVVNLRGLKNVTRIGLGFLYGCRALPAVDLAPLSRVEAIRACFMSACQSLKSIDLAPLSRLTTLPPEFLRGCSSLQSLDCSPLRSVTCLERGFVGGCTALQELNVSSFGSVTEIGGGFLADCSALLSLDLSSLANVTELGDDELRLGQLESLIRPEMGVLATAPIARF